MFESLSISSYKNLSGLSLDGLGQFNLVVGRGDSGKTNLLEALFLLCSNGDPNLVWRILALRRVAIEHETSEDLASLIEWLWPGRRMERDVEISGTWLGQPRSVRLTKLDQSLEIPLTVEVPLASGKVGSDAPPVRRVFAAYGVESRCDNSRHVGQLLITKEGMFAYPAGKNNVPARLITPDDYGRSRPLSVIWSQMEEANRGNEALTLIREVFPWVDAISVRSDTAGRAMLRVRHVEHGIMPVEQQGSGFGKILAASAYMGAMTDGVVLMDEFETSVDAAALPRYLRFIVHAARRNRIQVWATTHSLEALDAFVAACTEEEDLLADHGMRVIQLGFADGAANARIIDSHDVSQLRGDFAADIRLMA